MEVLQEVYFGLSREFMSTIRALALPTYASHCVCMIPGRKRHSHLDTAQLALGHIGQLDLLDGNSLASTPVESLVDRAERSLADAVAKSLRVSPKKGQGQPNEREREKKKKKGGEGRESPFLLLSTARAAGSFARRLEFYLFQSPWEECGEGGDLRFLCVHT